MQVSQDDGIACEAIAYKGGTDNPGYRQRWAQDDDLGEQEKGLYSWLFERRLRQYMTIVVH